jgi:hypothetical protein
MRVSAEVIPGMERYLTPVELDLHIIAADAVYAAAQRILEDRPVEPQYGMPNVRSRELPQERGLLRVRIMEPGDTSIPLSVLPGSCGGEYRGEITTAGAHYGIFQVYHEDDESGRIMLLRGRPSGWPDAKLVSAPDVFTVGSLLARAAIVNAAG